MRFPLLLALLVNVRKMVCGLTRRNVLLHSKTAVGGVPSQCGHPKLNNANLKEKSSSCQPWSSQLHSQQSASCLPHLLPHNCHICWEGSFDCSSDKKMKGGEQERHQIFTSWLRTGFYFNPTTWTRRSFGSLLPGAEQRPPDVWKKPSQLRFNSIYCLAQTLIWYYLIAIRIFINICDKVMGSALHLVLLHMHWRASPPFQSADLSSRWSTALFTMQLTVAPSFFSQKQQAWDFAPEVDYNSCSIFSGLRQNENLIQTKSGCRSYLSSGGS